MEISKIEIAGGRTNLYHHPRIRESSRCSKLLSSAFLTIFILLGSGGRLDTSLQYAPASEADSTGR